MAGGAKVIKKGTLTVCTHLPYKPFQYNQGGKVVGFDVDMMDLVAKLDSKQSIFDTPFKGIESGQSLNTGKCDVAAAGMTITDDRRRRCWTSPSRTSMQLKRSWSPKVPDQGPRGPERQDRRRASSAPRARTMSARTLSKGRRSRSSKTSPC